MTTMLLRSMAITNVAEYAHLSEGDVEALAVALEAIRRDIEDSRGEMDRTYIQRTIAFQRYLVEHIVHNRMLQTRATKPSTSDNDSDGPQTGD